MTDKTLKQSSDALFLVALVLLVLSFVLDANALLGVAAAALAGSVVLTVQKRRRAKARKA